MFDGVNVMKSTRWKEDAGMCMRQQRNKPRLSLHSLTLPAAQPASRWMNQSLSREFSSGLPLLRRHLIWEIFNHVCFPMFRPNDKSFLMGGKGVGKKRCSKSWLTVLSPVSDLWSQGWICHQLQIFLSEWDIQEMGRGTNVRFSRGALCCSLPPSCPPAPNKNLQTSAVFQMFSCLLSPFGTYGNWHLRPLVTCQEFT